MLPVPCQVATGIFQIRCMGDSPSDSIWTKGLENHCLSCPKVVGGGEVVLKTYVPVEFRVAGFVVGY